jgi:hypothetical protein
MGRKNKIFKNMKEVAIDPEDEIDLESDELHNSNHIEFQSDMIWEIGVEIADYCRNRSLPLCDYMTHDKLQKFVGDLLAGNGYWEGDGPGAIKAREEEAEREALQIKEKQIDDKKSQKLDEILEATATKSLAADKVAARARIMVMARSKAMASTRTWGAIPPPAPSPALVKV